MLARMETMSTTVAELSNPLPTAKQALEMLAQAQAEKASEALRHKEKADAEKKALIDKLSEPSGISEQEAVKRATEIIQRAIRNGLTEVEVFRFPNVLCTDRGRAINNYMEPGWENTLTGLPKEMYDFWDRHLRPLGYKLSVRVVDFSSGVPGDIGFTLKWS
jgi:capsule polysaccharide export protein KpsC/LpsZ